MSHSAWNPGGIMQKSRHKRADTFKALARRETCLLRVALVYNPYMIRLSRFRKSRRTLRMIEELLSRQQYAIYVRVKVYNGAGIMQCVLTRNMVDFGFSGILFIDRRIVVLSSPAKPL